ncbi:unnamed protein product, partial [Didymodactylos carnosus]
MPSSDQTGELSARNEKKVIPPVSLVHVPSNSFYACTDGQFSLCGTLVSSSNTSLIIISNNTLSRPDIDTKTCGKQQNYLLMASRIHTMLTKLFGTPQYRGLIIGLDASGKTAIIYRLKLNEVIQTIPTIGFNVETVIYENTALTMWDVGGCDKIRPLIRHYFQNTQALIFVVDSQDNVRLGEATDELWRMLGEDELIQIPILFYLNKVDIHNGLKQEYVIKEMRLNDIRNRQWFLQPCSALTGDGLYEGLHWLIRAVKSPLTSQSRHTNIESSASTTARENSHDENKSLQWLSQEDDDTNEEFVEKFKKHQLSV